VIVDPDSISNFACLPPRFAADARIPYVSWAENELILAEAYAATGDTASARVHLNTELASVPLPAVASGLSARRCGHGHDGEVRRAVPEHRDHQ